MSRRAGALLLAAAVAFPGARDARAQAPPDKPPAKPAAAAPPAPAAASPAGTPTAETGIEGFRSARFGMTEAQVRAAVKADFKLADSAIKAATHPVEQTRLLQVSVPDLVANGGVAHIHYVLGFRSKTLIQVNVLWSAADTAGSETILAVAHALRDLFVSQGQTGRFKKESLVTNSRAPDGSVVIFRGADDKNRMIQLLFASAPTAPATAGGARQIGAQLRLMYILSPEQPDIRRISPGQF
ncbi:MAG: hypothetical protein KIT36_08870 [Alphaproteobacteria bacterium]|nr:hypothetical protein [Alphaproteobacteria bacterium]